MNTYTRHDLRQRRLEQERNRRKQRLILAVCTAMVILGVFFLGSLNAGIWFIGWLLVVGALGLFLTGTKRGKSTLKLIKSFFTLEDESDHRPPVTVTHIKPR